MHEAETTRSGSWTDRAAYWGIAALSSAVLLFLLWLIYLKPETINPPEWSNALPAASATFNSLSAICVVCAVLAIRRGYKSAHISLVLTALLFSILFLSTYILHHAYHGDTKFNGSGLLRILYFFVLGTHIPLSMVILPLIMTTMFFALTGRFKRHRRLARITFPAWLYVSVTGVLIFLLLSANK